MRLAGIGGWDNASILDAASGDGPKREKIRDDFVKVFKNPEVTDIAQNVGPNKAFALLSHFVRTRDKREKNEE